jgi:glutamate dehydrogenase (NAD(P)+)
VSMAADGPGYQGLLVIDSVVNGTTSGGVRIAADIQAEEVERLAREMTLKFALFQLPRGGAKAGIRLDPELTPEARDLAIFSFGRQIGPIIHAGLYNPGMDMNCGPRELEILYQGAGIAISPPTDSSFFTAVGVANAIEVCADTFFDGTVRIGIEGFGRVSRHLVKMLPPGRFRIVAISTALGGVGDDDGLQVEQLTRAAHAHGDALVRHIPGTRLSREAVLVRPMDILIPGARTGAITMQTASSLQARAVVPVANAPYQDGTVDLLTERGVLCLPGYLCNAGGVVGSTLADSGVSLPSVARLFRTRYRSAVREIVEACGAWSISPVVALEEFANGLVEARSVPPRTSWLHRLHAKMAHRLPRAARKNGALRRFHAALDAISLHFRFAPGVPNPHG